MQANIIEPARDMDLRLRTINSIHNRIPIRRFTPSWGPALSNEYTEPLSGLALLPIQQKRSFYHLKDLLLGVDSVSYTHLRAHETGRNLVCRLLLEKKKNKKRKRTKKKKKK